MRKILLSLIAITTICTNVWGDGSPWTSGGTTVTLSGSSSNMTLTITKNGTGNMKNYTSGTTPWYEERTKIKHIVISNGVKSVGNYAFEGICPSGNTATVDVSIPVSCTSFGSHAFDGCSKITSIHYEGTPNEWANIDIADEEAHPFKGGSASDHDFYFYDSESATTILVLTPPITTIKQFAFYNSHFNAVNIPGTVTSIEEKALYCTISTNKSAINCRTAPELGSSAITSGTKFYIPTGASGYNVSPWSSNTTNQKVSGTIFESITWDLDVNGTLTLNATGSNKVISIIREAATSYDDYPWVNFRRLVNKVILKGEIEEVKESFTYCFGLNEVELDQTTIPTVTTSGSHATINFSSRFDQRNNVTLKIKSASLADATVSNLGSDPWDNAKLDIQLSDNLVINDNADYSTILANCSTYVEKPITMQLGRSLTNAQYNTFCSPTNLTKAQLNNADIRALESSSLEGEDLTLTFSEPLGSIDAGKPYLVKPSSELSNPIFENIDPSSLVSTTTPTVTTYVDFIGVLAPTPLTGGNKNTLFLGAGNELFWPEADGNIGGMRAYFSVKGAAQKNGIRARIVMNKEVATGIEDVRSESAGAVRSEKILRNGQIIIIHDGKEYNVMGIMMK